MITSQIKPLNWLPLNLLMMIIFITLLIFLLENEIVLFISIWLMLPLEMFSDPILAIRAGVSSFEPLFDTFWMESVKAR